MYIYIFMYILHCTIKYNKLMISHLKYIYNLKKN